jgi:hypothetical protein
MKQRKNYYMENNIDRLLVAAENRVETLKIQKEIRNIDARLTLLNTLHPQSSPPSASE